MTFLRRIRRRWRTYRLKHAKRSWPGYQPRRDGFDAEVMMCPAHEWIIEDRRTFGQPKGTDWNLCVVCRHCKAFRCGDRTDPNPCMEPRHHALKPHRLRDGSEYPIAMDPGASTAGGRWHL